MLLPAQRLQPLTALGSQRTGRLARCSAQHHWLQTPACPVQVRQGHCPCRWRQPVQEISLLSSNAGARPLTHSSISARWICWMHAWRATSRSTPPSPPPTTSTCLGSACAPGSTPRAHCAACNPPHDLAGVRSCAAAPPASTQSWHIGQGMLMSRLHWPHQQPIPSRSPAFLASKPCQQPD